MNTSSSFAERPFRNSISLKENEFLWKVETDITIQTQGMPFFGQMGSWAGRAAGTSIDAKFRTSQIRWTVLALSGSDEGSENQFFGILCAKDTFWFFRYRTCILDLIRRYTFCESVLSLLKQTKAYSGNNNLLSIYTKTHNSVSLCELCMNCICLSMFLATVVCAATSDSSATASWFSAAVSS